MDYRPLCNMCQRRPCAINYKREERIYFRSKCDWCIRQKRKMKPQKPTWAVAGYKMKPHCEKCGFIAKYKEQLQVFHVNGLLTDASWSNLKTVCYNCAIEISKGKLGWAQGGLIPDNLNLRH